MSQVPGAHAFIPGLPLAGGSPYVQILPERGPARSEVLQMGDRGTMEGWKGQEANAERGLAGAGVFKHDRTNIYSHELSSFVPRNNPMTFSTATI